MVRLDKCSGDFKEVIIIKPLVTRKNQNISYFGLLDARLISNSNNQLRWCRFGEVNKCRVVEAKTVTIDDELLSNERCCEFFLSFAHWWHIRCAPFHGDFYRNLTCHSPVEIPNTDRPDSRNFVVRQCITNTFPTINFNLKSFFNNCWGYEQRISQWKIDRRCLRRRIHGINWIFVY